MTMQSEDAQPIQSTYSETRHERTRFLASLIHCVVGISFLQCFKLLTMLTNIE